MSSSSSIPQSPAKPQRPLYIDRDDPRHQQQPTLSINRRRSRSPNARISPDACVASSRDASSSSSEHKATRWQDLRQPRKDKAGSETSLSVKPAAFRPVTTAATKRMATDISKWNRTQAQLRTDPSPAAQPPHGDQNGKNQRNDSMAASDHSDQPAVNFASQAAAMSLAELNGYDYNDLERIACLLCQRKFKSLETLCRHVSESQLHKDNLANADSCRQGVIKKLESPGEAAQDQGSIVAPLAVESQSQFAYRDRASERRAAFGRDIPSKASTSQTMQRVFDGPKSTLPAPTSAEEAVISAPQKPIDSDNVGSKLLTMMGWTQGQGLGLNRQGRTDIVDAKIYKPGAGLGSSAPTDTVAAESRQTGNSVSFTGYLDRAKDRARQRLAEHSSPHAQSQ